MPAVASSSAATWIAPADAIDRGNLLGAVNVACQRYDRRLAEVVEGAGSEAEALSAARGTGMLVIPDVEQVMPSLVPANLLIRCAQQEAWRLLLLDLGADSAAPSGQVIARFLAHLAATGGPALSGPLPPRPLRARVGLAGANTFRRSGLLHTERFEAALALAGVELAGITSLLEWGAGPGRMTRHLLERTPNAQLTAVDTDPRPLTWVADNLPVYEAQSIPVLPPTGLGDSAFDVVIGHSVFSHLTVPAQDGWLSELARVTRPGGHVAVSVNGRESLDWHLHHPLVDVPRPVAKTLDRDGVAVWSDDGWEDDFYEGYHTTFHKHSYIREHWSRWFDVILFWEAAATPTQDIVVLHARSTR